MIRWLCGLLAIALLCAPVTGAADEVAERIRRGLERYEAGKLAAAAHELRVAVDGVRALQAEQLRGLFPPPLAGWTAEESVVGSAGGSLLGGTAASRRYGREDPNGWRLTVDVEIVGDSGLAEAVAALLATPDTLAAEPGARRVEVRGRPALQRFSPREQTAEVTLALGGRVLVSARAQGARGAEEALAYARVVDYGAVEACLLP